MDYKIFILFLLYFVKVQAQRPISCLNNNGQPVDWWVILKSPGTEFHYYDNLMASAEANEMAYFSNIIFQRGALNFTTKQYYDTMANDKPLSCIFNDDQKKPHEKKNADERNVASGSGANKDERKESVEEKKTVEEGSGSKKAHMKGAILFHGSQGFFLTHSIPGFLNDTHDFYPGNGIKHGQHAFCITINKDGLKKISEVLHITHPHIYRLQIPNHLKNEHLQKIVLNDFEKEYMTPLIGFPSNGKLQIKGFTLCNAEKPKDSTIAKAFWDEVAFSCFQKMKVASWRNKNDKCKNYDHDVKDIAKFRVRNVIGKQKHEWGNTNDHSKYGITRDSKTICFGDLNHTGIQSSRGGAIYCIGQVNNAEDKDIEIPLVNALINAIEKTFEHEHAPFDAPSPKYHNVGKNSDKEKTKIPNGDNKQI